MKRFKLKTQTSLEGLPAGRQGSLWEKSKTNSKFKLLFQIKLCVKRENFIGERLLAVLIFTNSDVGLVGFGGKIINVMQRNRFARHGENRRTEFKTAMVAENHVKQFGAQFFRKLFDFVNRLVNRHRADTDVAD